LPNRPSRVGATPIVASDPHSPTPRSSGRHWFVGSTPVRHLAWSASNYSDFARISLPTNRDRSTNKSKQIVPLQKLLLLNLRANAANFRVQRNPSLRMRRPTMIGALHFSFIAEEYKTSKF
jgi:hypothetical protein